ncbi:MAG: energy-coupling factor ABC transporter permease, partial [Sutterella sp.]|nr:energy-coupling factor ABC transporter permease [Sutterella sp.]
GILISGLLTAAALFLTEEGFRAAAAALLAANLPVMIAEGVITLFAVRFLQRARPELLKLGD